LDLGALTYTPDPAHPFLPRLVVGTIQGGGAASSTAERCVAQGDVRFLPTMSIDQLKRDLQRVVERVCRETPGLSGKVSTVRHQWSYAMPEDARSSRASSRPTRGLPARARRSRAGCPPAPS